MADEERRRFPRWWIWLLILAVLALTLYMTFYPPYRGTMDRLREWQPLW